MSNRIASAVGWRGWVAMVAATACVFLTGGGGVILGSRFSCGVACAAEAEAEAGTATANLVPWPRSVEVKTGSMALGSSSRIVVTSPVLRPVGDVLAGELHAIVGLELRVVQGEPAAGDIVLELDALLKGEAYTLEVGPTATVHGGNPGAVALGTVTLLQSVVHGGGGAALPHVVIRDEPRYGYRGLLVDVARQYHPIENLKQIVELCRFYKIRYLQLHLTDDPLFMFTSKAYPLLGSKNSGGKKPYTIEQLEDLVAYADARNVTIVPEYEMPGHCAAENRSMPKLFMIHGTKPYEHHASINFVREDVRKAVETVVGEMCDVFKSSPYFHIGGDEADLALAMQNADFQAAAKRLDLPNQQELYRHFIAHMDDVVKRHGKQMIVWEGFGPRGKVAIPKDVVVMSYEIRFYKPDALLRDGYRVVNASWVPLYVVNKHVRPPAEIYAWSVPQFKPFNAKPESKGTVVPPSPGLMGAQMCAWQQKPDQELPSLRERVPAMAERVWNPDAGKSFADFERRFDATDKLLDAVISPGK